MLGPANFCLAVAACSALGSIPANKEIMVPQAASTMVDRPPLHGESAYYVGTRTPLVPNPLLKLPIGSIRPEGWLRRQLEELGDGLIGRLPEISKWCDAEVSAWRSPTGTGDHGWEELPYWLRGFTDLAYVLQDESLMGKARGWIDALLASQEPDGYFGPRENKAKGDLWPNMLAINVLQSFHEATGDRRVIPFMLRYFRWQAQLAQAELLPGSWQKIRAGDNLESVLWLYSRTGEDWLLDLAHRIHRHTVRWDLKVADWHGVNICQGYREPAVYYLLARERRLLDAAERNYQTVMTLYGQVPGGMFGADENCRPGYHGPRQAAETCSMVEFMHSFEMLLAITGDAVQADRCEEVAFNDLPAAMTPDLVGLHYLTAPNMVKLDGANKAPGLQNSGDMLTYNPHRYRCCQHNTGIGWPYFAEHLWMATRDNGLAATLYAACEVEAKVGDGVVVRITEATDYPFDEGIAISIATPRPASFPLYLRIPGWCREASVSVNGESVLAAASGPGYVRLDRTWADGDKVVLHLPMEIEVETWPTNADSVSVRRGPLWYSLKIGEQWVRSGGTDDWPAYEVLPTTPWNYGVVLDQVDPATSFKEFRNDRPVSAQPFVPDGAPVELRASGKRIPAWALDEQGLVGELQASPVHSDEPQESITLIPMGCARLRISVFPRIATEPQAGEWVAPSPPRHEASYCWEVIYALSDEEIPSRSDDAATPRLTWLGHRGTAEWVTYRFAAPRRVSWCDVFWVDDGNRGSCRAPASWRVLYRSNNEWREVSGASGYPTELDRFNRVTFDAVEATELKLEVHLQPDYSGGIFEWRVGGPDEA